MNKCPGICLTKIYIGYSMYLSSAINILVHDAIDTIHKNNVDSKPIKIKIKTCNYSIQSGLSYDSNINKKYLFEKSEYIEGLNFFENCNVTILVENNVCDTYLITLILAFDNPDDITLPTDMTINIDINNDSMVCDKFNKSLCYDLGKTLGVI